MNDHHAILKIGKNFEEVKKDLILSNQNTEFLWQTYDVFSISDARKIIEQAQLKPFRADTVTIVINCLSIAIEAQQALLKILEEPPSTTRFVFVLKEKTNLLPTLLSRFSLELSLGDVKVNELFENFLNSDYQTRLENIALWTKDKDTQKLEEFRSGLVTFLSKNGNHPHAARLFYCLSHLGQRGASRKMLMEQLALLLEI